MIFPPLRRYSYRAAHRSTAPARQAVVRRGRVGLVLGLAAAACAAMVSSSSVASAHPLATGAPGHSGRWVIMHESIDHASNSYRFTATGPVCPAGDFVDHITVLGGNAAGTVVNWQVDTTYRCDDGSGDFTAVKHLIRFTLPTGTRTWGQLRFTGGTGSYTGQAGHGFDWGQSANGTATGTVFARISSDADSGTAEISR